MLLLGLTGGIATGKSTVSRILSSPPYSLPLIDADVLARKVVEPGTRAYNAIVRNFGPTTPDLLSSPPPPASESEDKGEAAKERRGRGRPLDRAALGRRVFGSTSSRTRDRKILNGIVHPAVRLAMAREILYYYVRGYWCVVLDIPLLFESGLDIFCGVVLMVGVSDPVVQMKRLRARDPGLSEREAEGRLGSQMPVGEKVERCEARGKERGVVVWNDAGMEELRVEVERVVRLVEKRRRGGWGLWLWGSPYVAGMLGGWEVWRGWGDRRRWEGGKRERSKL